MKKLFLTLCVFLVMCTCALASGGDVIFGKFNGRMDQVYFSHDSHGSVTCKSCHHTVKGRVTSANAECGTCHEYDKSNAFNSSYYKAFHSDRPRSCVGCHKVALPSKKGCYCHE